MMVFWSRDPDGTRHNQGDSLGRLPLGIDRPASLAAIANADHDLAKLMTTLKDLGLDETTDVIIAAHHRYSTILKNSATSFAASQGYKDKAQGQCPRFRRRRPRAGARPGAKPAPHAADSLFPSEPSRSALPILDVGSTRRCCVAFSTALPPGAGRHRGERPRPRHLQSHRRSAGVAAHP